MLDAITDRFSQPSDELEAPRLDCDVDTIGTVVGNQRRRRVIQYLTTHGDTTVGELADYIARQEAGGGHYASEDRKSVYVTLYQLHLDELEDAGAVTWDKDRKTVAKARNLPGFAAILDALDTATGGDPA